MTKEEFINKILELGAQDELACSEQERNLYREAAISLYEEYFNEIKSQLLTRNRREIGYIPQQQEDPNVFHYPPHPNEKDAMSKFNEELRIGSHGVIILGDVGSSKIMDDELIQLLKIREDIRHKVITTGHAPQGKVILVGNTIARTKEEIRELFNIPLVERELPLLGRGVSDEELIMKLIPTPNFDELKIVENDYNPKPKPHHIKQKRTNFKKKRRNK